MTPKQKPNKKETCSHGHRPDSHPNCFIRNWYDEQNHRVGYLDIEATGFNANDAWMLSWAIKERGGKVVTDHVRPDEIFKAPGKVNMNYDRGITKTLLEEMRKYTVLVGYYSTGFDFPFIRSRAMKHNLSFPSIGQIYHIDLFYHVRNKLKLSRNSLKVATQFLEIAGKTSLDFSYWGIAGMGDVNAMKELLHHNEQDVIILEQLHKKMSPFCKFTKRSI